MVCFVLVTWSLILVVVYFVVRKIISRLRIDRYTDVYVLITGCDTGFGNEAAKRFDRMGCHVFAGCLTEDGRGSLKHGCSDRLHAISLDVTKIESIREAYDYVRNNLPKGRGLWGVINNAGIFGKMGPLEWLRLDDYREVCDVNLYGVIEATMTFLPLVKKARGRIYSQYGPHLWSVLVSCNYTILHLEVWCRSIYRRSEAFTSSFGVKAVLIEPGSHKTHLTSTENYFNLMTAAWNGASAEAKAEYGEEFLQEAINSIIKFTDIVGSDRITDVVDAYEEGLLDRYPRARYLVGKDCYTILLPLQAMPEWLGDWLLDSLGKPPRPLSRNQLPYSKNNK